MLQIIHSFLFKHTFYVYKMNETYTKDYIHYLNTKYGSGWIRMPEKTSDKYVLYATGDATISGRVYVALKPGPLSYEDKIKYNIM